MSHSKVQTPDTMSFSKPVVLFSFDPTKLNAHQNSKISFEVHDLYGKRKIPHTQLNRQILIDPADIIFDCAVTKHDIFVNRNLKAILKQTPKGTDMQNQKKIWEKFLDLYTQATGCVYDVCFAEVCMSFDGEVKWNNNFVCLVPIRRIMSNTTTTFEVLSPFHGCLWECSEYEKHSYFTKIPKIKQHNPVCDLLFSSFDKRIVMRHGVDILKPFLRLRCRDNNMDSTKSLLLKSSMMTFFSEIYGMYANIGLAHKCQTKQKLPFNMVDWIVKNTMTSMKNNFSQVNKSSTSIGYSKNMIDLFLSTLCYCMQELNLGIFLYRGDILGEDFKTRFVNDGTVSTHLLSTLLSLIFVHVMCVY